MNAQKLSETDASVEYRLFCFELSSQLNPRSCKPRGTTIIPYA